MTKHLNSIQEICTNLESSESELVVGHIYGMRQWHLTSPVRKLQGRKDWTEPPRLKGHWKGFWDVTGPNQATCDEKARVVRENLYFSDWAMFSEEYIHDRIRSVILGQFQKHREVYEVRVSVNYGPSVGAPALIVASPYAVRDLLMPWRITPGYGGYTVNGAPVFGGLGFTVYAELPLPKHDVTDPICTCGFYAYTDEQSLHENSKFWKSSVFGIVKAWGKVTQGTKGFRTEKAQIVGLTRPLSFQEVYTPVMTAKSFPEFSNDVIHIPTGLKVTVEKKWAPTNARQGIEAAVIPADFPRYSSLDEMLATYRKLTDNGQQ